MVRELLSVIFANYLASLCDTLALPRPFCHQTAVMFGIGHEFDAVLVAFFHLDLRFLVVFCFCSLVGILDIINNLFIVLS